MPDNVSIAVIGLGLIGGSILKSLKPKGFNLIGVSKSQETIDKAAKLSLASKLSTDINVIKDAKVVFICTPIHLIIPTIDQVRKIVRPDCIITDVGSIKGFIMDHVNAYEFPTNFIGGHPMAGTENKGIDSAIDNLFEGAKWVLTPSRWSDDEDLALLEGIINYTGAKVIVSDPNTHDKAVALISHMPLLLSQALFGMVADYPEEDIRELALKLAASGFRDTTRLAATNTELALDMMTYNEVNIKESVKELKNYTENLENTLAIETKKYLEKIEKIISKRKSMYSPDGKNIC